MGLNIDLINFDFRFTTWLEPEVSLRASLHECCMQCPPRPSVGQHTSSLSFICVEWMQTSINRQLRVVPSWLKVIMCYPRAIIMRQASHHLSQRLDPIKNLYQCIRRRHQLMQRVRLRRSANCRRERLHPQSICTQDTQT